VLTCPLFHSTDASAELSTASTFAQDLTDEQKTLTLRYILQKYADEPLAFSAGSILKIATEHHIPRQKQALLIQALQAHSCIWSCLVHLADALQAGQLNLIENASLVPIDRSQKPKARPLKQRRVDASQVESQTLETDKEMWADNWPQIEPEDSLKEVRCNLHNHFLA
jgi:hypothetical protein